MAAITNPVVRTIDPSKIVMTFMGPPITGFAPGTFVTVVAPDDFFEKVRGADGTVERYAKNVHDAEITITLLATSISNKALDVFHNLDKRGLVGGKGSLGITDQNGTIIALFPQAWVRKTPDWEGSDSASTVEWMFDTGPGATTFGLAIQ